MREVSDHEVGVGALRQQSIRTRVTQEGMTYVEALVLAFAHHWTNKGSELRSSQGQRKRNEEGGGLPVTSGYELLYICMAT